MSARNSIQIAIHINLRKSLEIRTSLICSNELLTVSKSNPIMAEGYAALISCTAVVQASDTIRL